MRKNGLLAIAFALAVGWSTPSAAADFTFDTNGALPNPPGHVVTIDAFDWNAGNSVIVENGDGTGTLTYQANLTALTNGSTVVYSNGADGAGSFFTAVATFDITFTGPGAYQIEPGGTFIIYATSATANDLTGTGFTSGTPILTGIATDTVLNSGSVNLIAGSETLAPNPAIPGCVPTGTLRQCLDQFEDNDIGPIYTLAGQGGTTVQVQITSFNSNYFTGFVGQTLIFAVTGTSNNLPYTHVDPSQTFFNGAPGWGSPLICGPGPGCVNGTGTAIMAEADAKTTFQFEAVSQVPEPATLTLLGMGLLGAAAARRRNKKNQK